MTAEEAEDAWHRFLLRTGPRVDATVLRWVADLLARETEPKALLDVSADLSAIAEVVAEEARCAGIATPP